MYNHITQVENSRNVVSIRGVYPHSRAEVFVVVEAWCFGVGVVVRVVVAVAVA